MNYDHAFHAGNFADVLKHRVLCRVLHTMLQDPEPLFVLDTHAGAGRYDFLSAAAARSPEYRSGILPYLAEAPEDAGYVASVRALNPGGEVRFYPGSPWLIAQQLRVGDRAVFCELHPAAAAALRVLMAGRRNVRVREEDGYAALASLLPPKPETRALVLVDPPFERSDDYARIVKTVKLAAAKMPEAVFIVWLPLKDARGEACAQALRAQHAAFEYVTARAPGAGGLTACGVAVIGRVR